MSNERIPRSSIDARAAQFQARSERLNALRTAPEPSPSSRVPVVGPLLAVLRRFWTWLATRWYVWPLVEQQNRFNEVVRALDELAAAAVSQGLRLEALQSSAPSAAGFSSALPQPFGYSDRPGEARLLEMEPGALLEWENADVPAIDRHREKSEAHADELLDEEFVQNYPLHWRTRLESWKYLFDLAISCEILGCNPGDLVLDYASGTCWVSEFLNRVGIRTVALDLSWDMLRQGRLRLGADCRLEQCQAATFTVGSAMQLPLANQSFDGVLCMNALHHMRSYRQALEEIYRILKPGGRAVFSEPGGGHAQAPISQTRMKELGVLEKSVSLPHIHRLAREIGFTRMRVVPLRDAPAYLFEYTATPADIPSLQQMWADTLAHSPRERSRFVLEKGPERPPDSLMPPAALLAHSLQARIALLGAGGRVRAKAEFTDRVHIANTGDVIW